MLIITRRIGETFSLFFDGYDKGQEPDIKVTICHVRGNQVRIGIKADEKVKILRDELLERLKFE